MNLFVGNLSPETTDADLRTIFSEFGEVLSARVLKDMDTGVSRGFGFVEMADKGASFDAIDNLDYTYLQGNIISVKEAKPKTGDRGGDRRGPGNRMGGGNSSGGGFKKPYNSNKPPYPRRDPNRL